MKTNNHLSQLTQTVSDFHKAPSANHKHQLVTQAKNIQKQLIENKNQHESIGAQKHISILERRVNLQSEPQLNSACPKTHKNHLAILKSDN